MTCLPRRPAGSCRPGIARRVAAPVTYPWPRACARALSREYCTVNPTPGPRRLLRRAIEADRIQSLILYGPPGTRQTTSLAQIIAHQTQSKFERLSGVESNVADMRRVLPPRANRLDNKGQPTILFLDEIHRFNKCPTKTSCLPDVESGVGPTDRRDHCTTHFFFVNSPLVSRSQIFEWARSAEEDLLLLLQRAPGRRRTRTRPCETPSGRRCPAPSGQSRRRQRTQSA